MVAITSILLITLLLYVILIGRYAWNWKNFPEYIPGNKKPDLRFSVIIPFRNEESQLPGILNDLSMQDYPATITEIILVDDHSHDDSVVIVQEYCSCYAHFRLVQLPDGKSGKKEALDTGIQTASHDYILTADADCRAGKQWLSAMASFCHDLSPAMVIGLVVTEASDSGFLGYFQQLESISLAGAGAASAIGGKPIYCSGANLCYRKEVYSGIHDPMRKSIASGDDTFLLLQMKTRFRRDIMVLKSRQALVTTQGEKQLAGFLKQRSRWISKSAHYRDWEIVYAAWVVMLANLAVMAEAVLWIAGHRPWLFASMLLTKLLLDGYFIFSLSAYFEIKLRPLAYIVSGIIYPFYLLIAVSGAFLAPVYWKGRKR